MALIHYYHPLQHGSASIKDVLPVLVPELSYADMEIGDGSTASSEYARIISGNVSEKERGHIQRNLLEYCGLDTLAMIRIVEVLRQLTANDGHESC